MRKFLSLLLAAVLICSTILLPASAEVTNEQAQLVAIENEIRSLQPMAVGDQTTYHICQETDGQVLTNGGGYTLFKGNFNASSTSQQWLFEEFGDYSAYYGVYYIRYAGNPSYVLGAKQSTGEVALVPATTSDYCIYWVTYSTSNGTYICPDYNLDSSGDGYLCMSTSYPFTFSISSSPTANCKVLLISPSVTQVTDIYIQNSSMKISVGDTAGIGAVFILPPSAAYNTADWLVYTSSNPSVCTIDQNGTIVGISDGIATITVKHKIFGASATCIVTVITPIQINFRLLSDAATAASISESVLQNYYNQAAAGIYEEFNVSFGSSSNIAYSSALDHNCPNTQSGDVCNETCGALSQCESLPHHKNAQRIMAIDSITTANTMRFVKYTLCAYDNGNVNTGAPARHFGPSGVTSGDDRDIVISTYYEAAIIKFIQHELCHTIGTFDNVCTPNENCVMNYNNLIYNAWCDNCRYLINLYLEDWRNSQ